MPDNLHSLIDSDAAFCLARVLILSILVSSEALLARRRRVGFEQHLILFSASSILLIAQIFAIAARLLAHYTVVELASGIWAWYPILTAVGLMGVAFCYDFHAARSDAEIRLHSRHYLIIASVLFALGALLTGLSLGGESDIPTTYRHLGGVSIILHGAQALAFLLLGWKAISKMSTWYSTLGTRILVLGCVAGLIGALLQIQIGPNEHFTTVAFTLLVAVVLRDNYRHSEMEAARTAEDRGAKMLLFHRITGQFKSSFDMNSLYEILMDSLISNLEAESGAIYLRNGIEGDLRPVFIHGPFPPPFPLPQWCPHDLKVVQKYLRETPIALGDGIIGGVAQSGTPVYLYDRAQVDRRYTWNTGIIPVRTTIVLALRSPEGIYGAVQLTNRINGGAFSEKDLRFMSLLVEQASLAIYNARLHAEHVARQRSQEQIKIARNIQLRLLPTQLPRMPGIAVGAEYSAAQEVGGDYYDIYHIDHDHLGLIVFDVAGKGVPAALLMAITATFLKMAAPRSRSPAWVLNEVNAALSAEMHRGLFVTAIYAVLKISTGELTLCNAGHPDALVIRSKDLTCERLKPRGAALGLLPPNRFRTVMEQMMITLHPGDTLLLYTDGVLEARNSRGEEFGEAALAEVGRRCATEGPHRLVTEILAAVRAHAGEAPQYDDTTMLALQLAPETTPAGGSTS